MFLEYLTNMYILPIIASIIGLVIVYVYDKFEKKQYSNSVYFRIAILIYISCLATIYISKLNILQSGGGGSEQPNILLQPNDIRPSTTNYEHFKTGIPTF